MAYGGPRVALVVCRVLYSVAYRNCRDSARKLLISDEFLFVVLSFLLYSGLY